jgi:hypothetical protein
VHSVNYLSTFSPALKARADEHTPVLRSAGVVPVARRFLSGTNDAIMFRQECSHQTGGGPCLERPSKLNLPGSKSA